jgi:hypothetical protein
LDPARGEEEAIMGDPSKPQPTEPLGQRLFNRPFLLLAIGLAVMFGFYTLWGVLEVMMLPQAPLP